MCNLLSAQKLVQSNLQVELHFAPPISSSDVQYCLLNKHQLGENYLANHSYHPINKHFSEIVMVGHRNAALLVIPAVKLILYGFQYLNLSINFQSHHQHRARCEDTARDEAPNHDLKFLKASMRILKYPI